MRRGDRVNGQAIKNKPLVAYFCMEYGLDNDFKLFSGGLGILAGDYIKAAYDAAYPMVAVGILWRQGYSIQTIGENGMPVDAFPEYRYPFLEDTGVAVEVQIKKKTVRCKVWRCDCYNNIPLYLLDTFLPDNPEALITGQLYGWFGEERLAQEIILGIGGVRALRALGIEPDLYHFNEGHAVFAGLELIRDESLLRGGSRRYTFDRAVEAVRRKIVFTTHTPVMAGNEKHSYDAIFYTGADNGFTKSELIRLGGDPFNVTVAALRLSRRANAVAELHAETARDMWAFVEGGADIIAVTNGVHNGTWQDAEIAAAAAAMAVEPGAGTGTGTGTGMGAGAGTGAGAGAGLRVIHRRRKVALIDEIKRRNGVCLDPEKLLIGFARRAAPYKRSDLIFTEMKRIAPLLETGRVQLVFSGKAHPNDMQGKQIVANLYKMTKLFPQSVVFLENYDMEIGKLLTRGCDVWLNNPIRPMEASGTSGMKAAMNGVLNLSILDGWWPEGCVHGVNGWQIAAEEKDCADSACDDTDAAVSCADMASDKAAAAIANAAEPAPGNPAEPEAADMVAQAPGNSADQDMISVAGNQRDAEALYRVLLEEVIPIYYEQPEKWEEMMCESIKMSGWQFSAARMLSDYDAKIYRAL